MLLYISKHAYSWKWHPSKKNSNKPPTFFYGDLVDKTLYRKYSNTLWKNLPYLKVKLYDHVTSENRGAAHNEFIIDLERKSSIFLPLFFQKLSAYDNDVEKLDNRNLLDEDVPKLK